MTSLIMSAFHEPLATTITHDKTSKNNFRTWPLQKTLIA